MSSETDVILAEVVPDESSSPACPLVEPAESASGRLESPAPSSPLVRFMDAFLQEKNIKWLLGIGALLVLGSSLRLVSAHWNDYPPIWKYFVFIAYSGAIYLAGEVSYWRLTLRKTGAGLMALTVLLMPITFLALHWAQPDATVSVRYLAEHCVLAVLLIGNAVLAYLAARRIFAHFLRGPQPTFLASYLILCVAGAVLPAMPGSWTPLVALGLWLTLTAGVIKVNRHVFWLVEENRLPRICGFFPIGLLAAQFITLVALNLVRFIPEFLPLPWLGMSLALTAVPILLTADAVAKVFEQRSGGLLRPFPWSVGLPLGVGLLLVIGGVALAATGLPRPFALPPTALIAAGLLTLVARRTRQTSLVWGALAAIVVAYNFSPVFFQELAQAIVHTGATAVREQRLPYAFYGLTYLPLLVAFSLASRRFAKRNSEFFARPLRLAAQGLAVALLFVAWGHSKALFPVGLALTSVFAMQIVLFRERLLIKWGVAAFVTAGLGWTKFADSVLCWQVTDQTFFLSLATVSGLLLAPGRWLDALARSRQEFGAGGAKPALAESSFNICEFASMLAAALTTCALLCFTFVNALVGPYAGMSFYGPGFPFAFPYLAIGCLCGLLLTHALLRLRPALGGMALASPLAFGFAWAINSDWSRSDLATLATGMGLGLWLLSYTEPFAARSRFVRAFAKPAHWLSLLGMLVLISLYYVPRLIVAGTYGPENLPWLMTLAAVAWCFDAARRSGEAALSAIGSVGVLGLASAAVAFTLGVDGGARWYPAAWAGVACLALPGAIHARRRLQSLASPSAASSDLAQLLRGRRALIEPIYAIALGVLSLTAIGSLVSISTAARVAGALAMAGFVVKSSIDGDRRKWRSGLILANWQIMAFVLQLCQPHPATLWQFDSSTLIACSLPIALCAALSQLLFELPRLAGGKAEADFVALHCVTLRWLAAVTLAASLWIDPSDFHGVEIALAAIAFMALTAGQLFRACRENSVDLVWLAQAIVGLAVGYFVRQGVIELGHDWSMYALLAGGVGVWGLGQLAGRDRRSAIMAGPLSTTGMLLPAGTVALAIYRSLCCPPTTWLGMHSLCLMLAAGFYFWQGIERPAKRLLILATAIANVALALLWRELSWSDPQLFMIPLGVSILTLVEMLKREMPESMHNPLRYCGALVILVSPTFHVVGGSWTHLLTLMVASVAIVLVSIGLRARALMYTGTAFLIADLMAIVVRGSVDRPNLLWIAGITLGGAVIALAAVAENHREALLQRVRLLAANIGDWE